MASWGSSQWGTVLPEEGALVQVDSVAQALDTDATFSVDNLGGLVDEESTVSADNVAQAVVEHGFAVDVLPVPFLASVLGALESAPYLLVEIDLPAGAVRVSEHCVTALGKVWDPRLVSMSDVLRTIGAGTDDMTLALDDTDTDGQVRYRDLILADPPEGSQVTVWLGAEGLAGNEHVRLFGGQVEAVEGVSYSQVQLRVVRSEVVKDRLLGELVTQAAHPDAPPESVGAMLPVVFGSVVSSEGVVVNTNALDSLTRGISSVDLVVPVGDATLFPAAGTVKVGSEKIDYVGSFGNELLVTARGSGGTLPAGHQDGDEVAELGDFVVQFAGHSVTSIKRVKLLLPNGNLGDPVPQPSTVDTAAGTATWDGLPQVRNPDARHVFQRIGFKEVSGSNLATDPQYAARENTGYEAFKVARSPAFSPLRLLANAADVGEPGDIEKVYLGVIFDPDSIPAGTGLARVSIGSQIGSGQFAGYALQPTDVVPDEIARNDEKTGDRIYDVPPPVTTVTKPSPQPFSVTPKVVVHPGIWAYPSNAARVVDQDEDTDAVYMFIAIGEARIVGAKDAVFQVAESASLPTDNGSVPVTAKIVFVAGWTKTPFTSTYDVWLRDATGGEVPGTRFHVCTAAPAVPCAGLIVGKERFEHQIDPSLVAGLKDMQWVVHPATGVSNGLWVGVELFIEGDAEPPAPTFAVTQDTKLSVTNYFDVTDLVPASTVPGAPSKDWAWFQDLLGGGEAAFSTLYAGDLRVIETFYVVRYRPFSQAGSQVPRVFGDVVGIVPSGEPAEIARSLIEAPFPLGLGLVDAVSAGDYFTAAKSLAADGVRSDFAVGAQRSIIGLLSQLAVETDCRDTWDAEGRHRIVRRPLADTVLAVTKTLTDCDLLATGGKRLTVSRSPAAALVNEFETKWRVYAPTGDTSRAVKAVNAPSQALPRFGRQGQVLTLALLSDDTSAALVGQRKVERQGFPRWTVRVDVSLAGLSIQQGDLVALSSREFSFSVCEVTEVTMAAGGLRRVSLTMVVWKV